MATNTYTALLTQTLSTAAASVTFNSIPQGYTDLVLVANMRGSGASFNNMTYPLIQFNGDTGTNYSYTSLFARNTGSSDTAVSERATNVNGIKTLANTSVVFSPNIIHIQNYSNTTTFKTVLNRGAGANGTTAVDGTLANVGLWRNTTAITSVTLTLSGTGLNFVVGSNFSLYGIASASVGAKATGGIISSDANYFYHTFAASGNFVPTQSLTCDYLVVAGGGGGGANNAGYNAGGGGGGAGGLRSTVGVTGGGGSLESALSLLGSTNYTVTIGAGGAGVAQTASNPSNVSNNGNNSVFGSITSIGGGAGGLSSSQSSQSQNGATGGSGGGAGAFDTRSSTGGTGTTNQGYAGGNVTAVSGNYGGAGGGGAGVVGVNNAGISSGTNGGIGITTNISGTSTYYAGGGGGGGYNTTGGTGGTGGGGNGGYNGSGPANGVTNTGGGGGGSGFTGATSGAGGSGIVIIRYPK